MIFEKQILNAYRSMAYTRCDDTGRVFYFSAADFDGLQAEPYPFRASAGHTLQGCLYHYAAPIPGRLVVFDHGFGGGHTAYMKEIECLCRAGFLVFAYDHTGCMASGGETTNGMAQSLCDLNDCLTALKAAARFAGFTFSVIGHSWGGFSCLNIAALHPDIAHVVVISGFISVEQLINSYFGGIMSLYRPALLRLERTSNPQFVGYSAVDTLAKTSAKVLLIYSDNDTLCKKAFHYDPLKAALDGRANIRFLLVPGKGHNPNYTADAVAYKDAFFADLTKKTKKKLLETPKQKAAFIASYDWARMTSQDDAVWSEILAALEA